MYTTSVISGHVKMKTSAWFLLITLVYAVKACNYRCQRCDETRNTCTECQVGWYGLNCTFPCQNCWVSGCQSSGICHQCSPGRYGEDCGRPCPVNCRDDGYGKVYCRREDGKCLEGCHKGQWGDTCNRPCNQNCDGRGCLQNGQCIGDCKVGWWGLKCDRKCPDGCQDGCGSMNGKCLSGCKNGFTSTFCNTTCSSGCMKCHQFTGKCFICTNTLYGNDCSIECGSKCVNFTCNTQGRCIEGCVSGFTGSTCHEVCPVNCQKCKQDDTFCTKCKLGWSGEMCDSRGEEVEMSLNDLDTAVGEGRDSYLADTYTGEAVGQYVPMTTLLLMTAVSRNLR